MGTYLLGVTSGSTRPIEYFAQGESNPERAKSSDMSDLIRHADSMSPQQREMTYKMLLGRREQARISGDSFTSNMLGQLICGLERAKTTRVSSIGSSNPISSNVSASIFNTNNLNAF